MACLWWGLLWEIDVEKTKLISVYVMCGVEIAGVLPKWNDEIKFP